MSKWMLTKFLEWKGVFAIVALGGFLLSVITGISSIIQKMSDIELQHILLNQKLNQISSNCLK